MPANQINDLKILEISVDQIVDIQEIANKAWPVAFAKILTEEQILYMMNWMYSKESLVEQFRKQHRFFLAESEGKYLGFMSIEHNSLLSGRTKIHKAYILPAFQNKGIGHALFDRALFEAIKFGDKAIYLNVNRYNLNAIAFYEKYGMTKIYDEVIGIGNGFVMDDSVFERSVDSSHD
ncbi:MAG: acetyltransferase [Bacteroidetes bacterium]|nr:acetyltransferase [Bacteroidota bacterium]